MELNNVQRLTRHTGFPTYSNVWMFWTLECVAQVTILRQSICKKCWWPNWLILSLKGWNTSVTKVSPNDGLGHRGAFAWRRSVPMRWRLSVQRWMQGFCRAGWHHTLANGILELEAAAKTWDRELGFFARALLSLKEPASAGETGEITAEVRTPQTLKICQVLLAHWMDDSNRWGTPCTSCRCACD